MKYAISNTEGIMEFDVSIEQMQTAFSEGRPCWKSTDNGITYILITDNENMVD